jgi:HPt (histidine-containing phosphotransfer) domain-containing protein
MIESQSAAKIPSIRSVLADDVEWAELLHVFAETLPEKRQTLRDLYRKGEFDQIRRWAHQLKGAGGSYGFPGLSQAAADLE